MKINFCKEPNFKYFARIKFSKFCHKDILLVAVVFHIVLKKDVCKAKQRINFSDSIILNFYGNYTLRIS